MKTTLMLAASLFVMGAAIVTANADKTPKHPKNVITQIKTGRKKNHTTRQVTPDPKKSPGKHADNLSKNVNHEANRESKDFNHGVNNISKGVNHAFQGKKP